MYNSRLIRAPVQLVQDDSEATPRKASTQKLVLRKMAGLRYLRLRRTEPLGHGQRSKSILAASQTAKERVRSESLSRMRGTSHSTNSEGVSLISSRFKGGLGHMPRSKHSFQNKSLGSPHIAARAPTCYCRCQVLRRRYASCVKSDTQNKVLCIASWQCMPYTLVCPGGCDASCLMLRLS